MKVLNYPDLLSIIKEKHILLDTTVFIDAFLNPVDFIQFLEKLKINHATLVTIDVVAIEFLKGAQDKKKFEEKKKHVEEIIDTYLPVTNKIIKDAIELTNMYHLDGKSVNATDFTLGAVLMSYPENIFLMTRNTNDFPTNIYNLVTCFNIVHRKGIFAYGLYEFKKDI